MPSTNECKETFILSRENIDLTMVQKMMFVYNALYDGWTIKKLEGEKFEFIKNNNNDTRKEINLEDFIKSNLNLNKLIN